jgi:RNA polymerase sigma factor (sigma-70 family)
MHPDDVATGSASGPPAATTGSVTTEAPAPLDELTLTFVSGGPDALRRVYDAHGGLVFTFCRRALGQERAADLTQEVFTEVWRNRLRFDPERGTLRGWVMGIARNKVGGALRHDASRPVLVLGDDDKDTTTVPADAERLADRLTLAHALISLPDRAQELIRFAYLEGLSHSEIADKTGIPLGTVKSEIRRGLLRLRADLGGES